MARSIKSVAARRIVLAQTSSSIRCFGAKAELRPFRRSIDAIDEIVEANPDIDAKVLTERYTELYPTAVITTQIVPKEAIMTPRAVHTYGASNASFWAGPIYLTSGDDWDQSWFGGTARAPLKRVVQMLVVIAGWWTMRRSACDAMVNGESLVMEMSKNWPSPEDKPIPAVTLPSH